MLGCLPTTNSKTHMYSLIVSAKMNGVDPQAWLADVLARIAGHPAHRHPVENVWQYLRQNWLSNTVFENYDAIVDAACAAWRNLIAQPQTITSIGMREWAHVGQPL